MSAVSPERCTGAADCPVKVHVHGCYADFGDCEAPGEHIDDGVTFTGGPEEAALFIASVSWPNERKENRDNWAKKMLTDYDLFQLEARRARLRLSQATRLIVLTHARDEGTDG